MSNPYVRVLGTADWLQSKNNDGSCYTVNDIALVDANSCLLMNLLNQDIDPINLSTIFFTHMHADHYMGLGPLLLYWRVRKGSLGELTIAGPKETVRAGFERALNYAFHDSKDISAEIKEMPTILELDEGDTVNIEGFTVHALAADHAVPGLCYTFTHGQTGKKVGFSGDTCYKKEFASFFSKADLLFYEASFGASPLTQVNEICRHSSVFEAVKVLEEAQAKKLMITHLSQSKREEALEKAKTLTDKQVELAVAFNIYPL